MSERHILSLTEDIYDAATGGLPWAVVGRGLCRLVEAESAALMAGDFLAGRAELLYHGDIPGEAVRAYRTHYRTVDLWTQRAAAAALRPSARPRVWTGGTLVPDAELLHSEFYAEFARPLGLRHVVGTVVPLGEAGVMPLGLHRPEGAAPFGPEHAALLERLVPHLRRALQLRHRLNGAGPEGVPTAAALDALAAGILVVDADLRILFANRAAEAAAAAQRTVRFVRGGAGGARPGAVLLPVDRGDCAPLAAAVRATALRGSPGAAVALHDREGSVAGAAEILPLPRRLADGPADGMGRVPGRALVVLRDLLPAVSVPGERLLRQVFGLTKAEAEVARALAGGTTKEMVAAARGARVSTVRTQVRAILAKTGAANLRALERLLGGLSGP